MTNKEIGPSEGDVKAIYGIRHTILVSVDIMCERMFMNGTASRLVCKISG